MSKNQLNNCLGWFFYLPEIHIRQAGCDDTYLALALNSSAAPKSKFAMKFL